MPSLRTALAVLAFGAASLPTRAAPQTDQNARFSEIDRQVAEIPDSLSGDLVYLAGRLSEIGQTEHGKARAIYTWIVSNLRYDTRAYAAGVASWSAPADVLRHRVAVCAGYAKLVRALGTQMGLKTVLIYGYAKEGPLRPDTTPRRVNHSWNAIRLQGRWLLLDATRGAGHVDGDVWITTPKEYYFDTPGPHLAFSHLPIDRKWLLGSPAMSFGSFLGQPAVPIALFTLGFSESAVREAIRENKDARSAALFPDVHEISGLKIRVEDAPARRMIPLGTPLRLAVHAPGVEGIVVGNRTGWKRLARQGDRHTGNFDLSPGVWHVFATFKSRPSAVFLTYEAR